MLVRLQARARENETTEKMNIIKRVTQWLTVIALAAVLTLGCSRSGTRAASNADLLEVEIPIQGMVCGSCVARTKRALKSVNGVEEVEVSLEKREARVRYDSTRTNPDQLAATINQLGYKAETPNTR